MPELPEVETTKQGILPHLEGQIIKGAHVRNASLRLPVPAQMNEWCLGKKILTVTRRAKYLIIHLNEGYLLIHLGMSGHLRVVPEGTQAQKHDHIDISLTNGFMLRYCDPRRFGLFVYTEDNPHQHSLLSHLGPEPLSEDFNPEYLSNKAQNKNQPVKSFIMNNDTVVGVGNIYASESLFLTGLHPLTPAKNLSKPQINDLTAHIKKILHSAITAGGTTLKDFYAFDGKPGYFRISLQVYGRKKQTCYRCSSLIDSILIAGRQSAFCPQCQPLVVLPE
ncbi:bifunctional DNA-formamidopyrimidine glycosylase/DNA-(apurinic or apyrimidinic site) lyase [Legionella worsleiensis]|uniref:Formamidopyrimidine-DNA glycosylase n=1 Tax=Legionella worsleiensis TaxID=45076 RepID=A0A0W1AFA7_9GAMM|nr:bifunctional DNA-formamidopyrimidine glycosylase/DNA-(apurinic or apyrimidinic site) lyase [Legionella worsleiensis]KTD80055.1 formamidopyrimidine-DNA glycosylase [Legionella worsleiensis]STY32528.1 formamidopyrimidine-DNA glycosylase [Legionella worsleiensis]